MYVFPWKVTYFISHSIATKHPRALICVTIESVARNLVIICFWIPTWAERLLARLVVCMYMYLVCGPFVQLISREISQTTSSLTFSTWDSRRDTRNYWGSLLSGTVPLWNWSVQWGAVQRWSCYYSNCITQRNEEAHSCKSSRTTSLSYSPGQRCFVLAWYEQSNQGSSELLQPLCRIPSSPAERAADNPWVA